MSDPLFALATVLVFLAVVAAASFFKNLEVWHWSDLRTPLMAGLVGGVLIRVAAFLPPFVTAAALYVRPVGRESEPPDGMALGAITGAVAAVPLIVTSEGELVRFAECVLAGAVAGYGITFGLTHVRRKGRQAGVDAITALVAVIAASIPSLALRIPGATEREVAVGAAALVPLLVVAAVFRQWAPLRAELEHEAALGFIDEADVRSTAHPIRRLGRAGWHDAAAHRELVRIATKIALRKLQQRHRSDDVARLYQLEVIKLRMQLREMSEIDKAMRAPETSIP
jgi:hypothetical protein